MASTEASVQQSSTPDEETLSATCFVCGRDNPHGLHLDFETTSEGTASAAWAPEAWTAGFPGVVHGGMVSTVLDESMAKAVLAAGLHAYTAELRVRLHRPVAPGSNVRVHGWIAQRTRRLIATEAAISDEQGVELAHAWASFLMLK